MNPSLNGISISVAMPIFNESDGIAETLNSIDEAFRNSGATVTMCIQNDVSTDNTLHVLTELATSLQLNIAVERADRFLGQPREPFLVAVRLRGDHHEVFFSVPKEPDQALLALGIENLHRAEEGFFAEVHHAPARWLRVLHDIGVKHPLPDRLQV